MRELKKHNAIILSLLERYMGAGVFRQSKPPDMGEVCAVLMGQLAGNQTVCGHRWRP